MNWREYKKVELHRHLEGSVRLETVMEASEELGFKLSGDRRAAKNVCQVLQAEKDLKTVLDRMLFTQRILATEALIERVAYENVLDAIADGIAHLELRYAPSYIALGHPELSYQRIHEAILKGIDRAKKEIPAAPSVGLIGIIVRDQPYADAEETLRFMLKNRDSFVGIDLAGAEAEFDSRPFKPLFRKAKENGLGVTIHAGEARHPLAAFWVKQAVEELGATRIGHGIQIACDPRMVDWVREKQVVLEVCPTSNLYTQAADSLADHPLKKLISEGVRCTLNSDDPHFFGIDLTHEYEILDHAWGFGRAEFDQLNANARAALFHHSDP